LGRGAPAVERAAAEVAVEVAVELVAHSAGRGPCHAKMETIIRYRFVSAGAQAGARDSTRRGGPGVRGPHPSDEGVEDLALLGRGERPVGKAHHREGAEVAAKREDRPPVVRCDRLARTGGAVREAQVD